MHLKDLPIIDGVSWRMFRDGDYDALADLLNEDLDFGGHSLFATVDDVSNGYQGLEGLNEANDILIAQASGTVIGQVTAATWKELDGPQIRVPRRTRHPRVEAQRHRLGAVGMGTWTARGDGVKHRG